MKTMTIAATAALASFALALPGVILAKEYPARPITIMVPFGAGGSTDTMARATARELEEILGVNIPVKNVGGGAGTIGSAQIARARADGYTVGVIPAAPLVNQPHMRKTPYTIESFTYICQLFHSPQALALKPGSQFASLSEIIDYARANPGKLTYGSPGPASLPHLAMEKFLMETKVEIKHVPFKGDAAGITALMGEHIDFYMAIMSNVIKNDLNAVAVFSEERVAAAPDLRTSIEQGFTTTAAWWGGMFAPKGISDEIKTKLENACEATTKTTRFKETLGKLGTLVQFKGSEAVREAVIEGSRVNGDIINRVLAK